MASNSDEKVVPLKSKNTAFPPIPKRGMVKARIFQCLANALASVAGADSAGNGGAGGENGGSSSASTHPNTTPNSD